MKILLVHNSYQHPGGEDVALDQEHRLLERAGHSVAIYRRSNREIEGYSALRRIALLPKIVWAADTKREFTRLLDQEKPDLVHIHNTFVMISPSIYSACQEADLPVVQTLHNYRLLCPAATFFRDGHVCEECLDHSLWRGIGHGCYRDSRAATTVAALTVAIHRGKGTWTQAVDEYVALSEFARQKFIDGGLSPQQISIKPNFVYPDPGERLEHGEYALFIGRLSEEKGLEVLLHAWRHLRPPIPLVIIGDGPLRARLEEKAALHCPATIVFRGFQKRSETCRAIKRAKFVIVPSQCYENFCLIICEAFACGTPIICSRLGAMRELIADGQTGLHFAPGEAADLASKVDWAWSHPERMAEMGREARREFEAKYTAETNYSKLMEIYSRAIATHSQHSDCPEKRAAQLPV